MDEMVMAEENWKLVSKEEFYAFMARYRPKLVYDVCGIFDPPIASYNDFSSGKSWPDSVVCYISLGGRSSDSGAFGYFIAKSLLD